MKHYKAIGCLLITVFGWGVMYPCSKHAVSSGIDGYFLTLIRYGLGTVFVSALLLLTEKKTSFHFEGRSKSLWLFGTIGFAGLNFLTFIGIRFSSAMHATIILATMPMMSVTLSAIMDKKMPKKNTLYYTILAFVGIFLVITNGQITHVYRTQSVLGDVMLLAATFCWVIYTYFGKTLTDWSALRTTALSSLLGTGSIIVITGIAWLLGYAHIPERQVLQHTSWDIFVLVITTGVIVTWHSGIKTIGPQNGILFVNLVPVITVIIGLYHGKSLSIYELGGSVITISSLILYNFTSRNSRLSANPSRKNKHSLT